MSAAIRTIRSPTSTGAFLRYGLRGLVRDPYCVERFDGANFPGRQLHAENPLKRHHVRVSDGSPAESSLTAGRRQVAEDAPQLPQAFREVRQIELLGDVASGATIESVRVLQAVRRGAVSIAGGYPRQAETGAGVLEELLADRLIKFPESRRASII